MSKKGQKPPKIKSIYRANTQRNFTLLRNELLQSRRMSYGALGLVCYLLSHPEDWLIKLDELLRQPVPEELLDLNLPKPESKKKIRGYISEARVFGYMGTFTIRNEKGRILEHAYWVTDDPKKAPIEPVLAAQQDLPFEGDNSPHAQYGHVDETGQNGSEIGYQGAVGDNSPHAHIGHVGAEQGPFSQYGHVDTLSKNKIINNNNYYNKYIFNARTEEEVGRYGEAIAAVEAYLDVQDAAKFQPALDVSPNRVARLADTITQLEAMTKQDGLIVWKDLLKRATYSPYCRGDGEPRNFTLSLDGMADLQVLEKISKQQHLLGPDNAPWKAWFGWAQVHDEKLAKVMQKIEDGVLKADRWGFDTEFPPTPASEVA